MKNRQAGQLHPRNPHRGLYDFTRLCAAKPILRAHVRKSPRGDDTIDFSDAKAVRCLNAAILCCYYGVDKWDFPAGYLCPPIPGRADYVHCLADLLQAAGQRGSDRPVRVLDIGVGANCIYPILGCRSYGWQFVGSDIDAASVAAATTIVQANTVLSNHIEIRLQEHKAAIFRGVIAENEYFELSMCNPPFHASANEAQKSNQRKQKNLHGAVQKHGKGSLNFSGTQNELWCKGGEMAFLKKMARESSEYREQVGCFSSLVSKSENVPVLKKLLQKLGACSIEVIAMSQGQKTSRLLAWRF